MLYHTLFFRFKPEVTESQLADFEAAFPRFEEIRHVKEVIVGPNVIAAARQQSSDGYSRAAIVVQDERQHFEAYVNWPAPLGSVRPM